MKQHEFEQELQNILLERSRLYAECNRVWAQTNSLQAKTDYDQKIIPLLQQIKEIDKHCQLLVKHLMTPDSNLKIWVPNMETLKSQVLSKLKRPTGDTEEDRLRNETLARLQNNTMQEFLQKEFEDFLAQIHFDVGVNEETKQKVYSMFFLLLTTEAGIRLIIKCNEDHKLLGNNIIIRQSEVYKWDSANYNRAGSIDINVANAYKVIARAQRRLQEGTIDVTDAATQESTPLFFTLKNGRCFPFIRGDEVLLAHEIIHKRHDAYGKFASKCVILPWDKFDHDTVEYFYDDAEEILTINPYVFARASYDRLTDALISEEMGYESRFFHMGGYCDSAFSMRNVVADGEMYNIFFQAARDLPRGKVPTLQTGKYDGRQNRAPCLVNINHGNLQNYTTSEIKLLGNFLQAWAGRTHIKN